MGEATKIEWCDHTFNPWIGCQKVGAGCDNCYAEALMDHRYGKVQWGPHGERKLTSDANWRKPKKWDLHARASNRQAFVFCASLADVFDNEIDPQWRTNLFTLILSTSNLTWLLLTKRVGNVRKMVDVLPRNVAIGGTMVNQEEYDRDSMKLADIKLEFKPAFTFASIEPMLGPIILNKNAPDWIICGGESGRDARLMQPEWARAVRDHCAAAGTPFFMKQMTGKKPIPDDLMVRQFPHPER